MLSIAIRNVIVTAASTSTIKDLFPAPAPTPPGRLVKLEPLIRKQFTYLTPPLELPRGPSALLPASWREHQTPFMASLANL